jgi:hypothetical protein
MTDEFGWGDIPNFQALCDIVNNQTEEIAQLIEKVANLEQIISSAQFLPVAQIPIVQPRNWRDRS